MTPDAWPTASALLDARRQCYSAHRESIRHLKARKAVRAKALYELACLELIRFLMALPKPKPRYVLQNNVTYTMFSKSFYSRQDAIDYMTRFHEGSKPEWDIRKLEGDV